MKLVRKATVAAVGGLLVVAGLQATSFQTASAVDLDATHYASLNDVQGANDQPGQKDLTRQGGDTSNASYIDTYIQWDDLTVSGGNTLDACSLVDTDSDGNANAAVCATLARNNATTVKLSAWTVYTCTDQRSDRCTGGVVVTTGSSAITTDGQQGCSAPYQVGGAFDTTDTRVYCTITAASLGTPASFSLRNTCSYPSAVPNSDPSDCVLKTRVNVGAAADSTKPVVPNASIALTGNGAADVTGTVDFVLYPVVSGVCQSTPVNSWLSVPVTGSGTTFAAASGNDITQPDVVVGTGGSTGYGAGDYGWTITYSGDGNYNPVTQTCVQQFTAS